MQRCIMTRCRAAAEGGVEAAGTRHFLDTMWLFGSYAFNESSCDDNTYDGTGALVALTKDKTVVDAPKHIVGSPREVFVTLRKHI